MSTPRMSPLALCTCLAILVSISGLSASSKDLRLVDAVEEGNLEAVDRLLEERVDVNVRQQDGATALHWAVHRDDSKTVDLLIQAGADVNAQNDYGVVPLSLACLNRSAAMVERLLEARANPNVARWSGETVLMTCARTGNAKAVKALLVNGADPNGRENRWHQTALMWAIAKRYPDAGRALVEHGADIQARSTNGFTPLLFAAQQGNLEAARFLVEAGANLDDATHEHGNIVTVASASGHEDLGIFFLEKGANPNVPDQNGVTALHHAIGHALSVLTGLKYDPYYRLEPDNMPRLVQALLDHGANPNAQIQKRYLLGPNEVELQLSGITPFFLAAVAADIGIMQSLLAKGADPILANKDNFTPLMAAAGAAHGGGSGTIRERSGSPLEAVKLVLELGGDIHAVNSAKQTALHFAAFSGENAMVQLLVDQGAQVDAEDWAGQTPWTMAMGISPVLRVRGSYGSHPDTAALLLKLGAKPRSREQMDTRSNLSFPEPTPDPAKP